MEPICTVFWKTSNGRQKLVTSLCSLGQKKLVRIRSFVFLLPNVVQTKNQKPFLSFFLLTTRAPKSVHEILHFIFSLAHLVANPTTLFYESMHPFIVSVLFSSSNICNVECSLCNLITSLY